MIRPGTLIVQKNAYVSPCDKPRLGHWVGLVAEINNNCGNLESVMIEWVDSVAPPDYNPHTGISFTILNNRYDKFDLFPADEKSLKGL